MVMIGKGRPPQVQSLTGHEEIQRAFRVIDDEFAQQEMDPAESNFVCRDQIFPSADATVDEP